MYFWITEIHKIKNPKDETIVALNKFDADSMTNNDTTINEPGNNLNSWVKIRILSTWVHKTNGYSHYDEQYILNLVYKIFDTSMAVISVILLYSIYKSDKYFYLC